ARQNPSPLGLLSPPTYRHRRLLRPRRYWPRGHRASEQCDELAPLHRSAPASVKGLNLLRLRRGLPCHKLPSLRSLGPDVEKFEPEAARLAVNLGLYRGTACDERGIADHAHLTVRKASALILGLARSHRFEPGRLGVSDGGGAA